jgi:hypothetical protein
MVVSMAHGLKEYKNNIEAKAGNTCEGKLTI